MARLSAEKIRLFIKRLIPARTLSLLLPAYHYGLSALGAVLYGFPARRVAVIAVTGTKGKSTTVELVNAILEKAGYKTALSGTVRFKIGGASERNTHKMTMPGRFFLQRFLARAVQAGCDYAIVEMTSEGAAQYRHKFIRPRVFIFTNITPEHIESHGSFEKYLAAKLSIARQAKGGIIVANTDDPHGEKFLAAAGAGAKKHPYSLASVSPYDTGEKGARMTFRGMPIRIAVPGIFNILNAAAAATAAHALGVGTETIKEALEAFRGVPGRMEFVREGNDFDVVVDYAHTPESLESVYRVFAHKRKICVLGSAGGGRDTWKRPKMGAIAENHCDEIILTDEDPYDEDPKKIIADIARGMRKKKPLVILDRKKAIEKGVSLAKKGDVVIITGKGTDPFLMKESGRKIPWSDMDIARAAVRKRTASV